MALHPGERTRHFPEDLPAAWDPIRRVLEENEDWYRDLVEHSRDLLCIHDLQGRFLLVNPVPARLLGYSVEEVMRKPMRDFIDPKFHAEFDGYLREIESMGESRGLMSVVTRTGEKRILEYHATLRTEGVGTPIVRGIGHDVTERVLAEKALRDSNETLMKTLREQERTLHELTLFRTLLDQSNDAIEVMDPETLRFLDVNERACLQLGYSREELLSMTVYDIDKEIDESFRAQVRQHVREAGFITMERMHRRKDGTALPVEVNFRKVQLDREYGVTTARDITARKAAQERLLEFERVVENLEEMIVVVDRDYRYVLANRAFLGYRELTREQVVGRRVAEIQGPEVFAAVVQEKLDECFLGQVVSYELRHDYPAMGSRDISITYLPIEGPAGVDRVACVGRDVTERKRAEETLRQSEARERARAKELETVLEAVPVAVCIAHDLECRRMTGNRAAYEQMRVPAGGNLSKSAPPEERPALRLMENGVEVPVDLLPMQQAAASGRPEYGRALTLVYDDGTECETLANVVPLLDEEGKPRGVVGASIDVTPQKLAERALRESELRFRTVYERSPLGIALVDSLTGQFLQVNPKFCEITGRSQEELLRTDVRSIAHPDDIARGSENPRLLAEEKLDHFEMQKRYLRPDGSVRWVRLLVTSMGSKADSRRWEIGLIEDITELREAREALREAQKKLTEEKLYLEQEINAELGFGDIIGQSKALQSVMEQVGKVAATNATVLLLGETGTGKELVARAVHWMSQRTGNSFIKLNCAAIPSGLLESELFGNEKGAFTGAVSKKIGRIELADKGTLFLDEIGEISLALQPKLLRVLQDQEFERLGGTQTLKVDFRLIAATNRDLADAVRENEFRSDLYYRLNVFPIRVPPLRERREDIQVLVEHFVQKFARRMNRSITSIPKKTMDALKAWEWPGNVRELENFVERSVILTQGSVLASPLTELKLNSPLQKSADESLEAAERDHILRALRECHGQIGGPRGAAVRLGLKRTTLQSKLKHLGIDPRSGR